MEIWIVGFETGVYEDRHTIPVAAYTDKAVAELVKARFESELAAAGLDSEEAAQKVEYDKRYWRGLYVDYCGASIYVSKCIPLNIPVPQLPNTFGTADTHLR